MKTNLFIENAQERPLVHVFVHHSREYIEMRAYDDSFYTNGRILYGKDNDLGTALTDFLETDLSSMQEHIERVQNAVENSSLNSELILEIAEFWLAQSCFFATFASGLIILLSDKQENQKAQLSQLQTLAEQYHNKQQLLSSILARVKCFTGGAHLESYLRYSGAGSDSFPRIQYGTISHELCTDYEEHGYRAKLLSDDEFEDDIFNIRNSPFKAIDTFPIVVRVVHCNSLDDLFFFLLANCLEEGIYFRNCKCCGKWFAAPHGSSRRYCTRLAPGSKKTCKEIGGQRMYDQRRIESPENREYVRSYKAHYARLRGGRMEEEDFKQWALKARYYRDQCSQGLLSLEDYIAWLDKDKYYVSTRLLDEPSLNGIEEYVSKQ